MPSNDVIRRLAEALDVEAEHFREYRLRAITEQLEELPDLVDRLYQPFYRDKQEYQPAGAEKTNWYPIFGFDKDQLRIRFNTRVIRRGYQKTGQVLDNAGAQCVEVLNNFLADPAHRHDFWMERGQIQILNNRSVVHGRTPYIDNDEPEKRRHLVRLWIRAGDRRQFRG